MIDSILNEISSVNKSNSLKDRIGKQILISKLDANKKVEVNEAFTAEWQKHECLWYVKARVYKDRNARENALKVL